MAPTLKDIAKEAGVSPMAVSSVLNHTKSTRVSASTRKRIIETAERMEYHRNELAGAIRTGSVNTVALIVQFTDYFDLNKVVSGILSRAHELNYGIRIYDVSRIESAFEEILRNCITRIICLDLDEERRERINCFCEKHAMSLCYLLEKPHGNYPVVASALRNAMTEIVRTLHRKGYERIGVFGVKRNFHFFHEMMGGYYEGLKSEKLTTNQKIISLEPELEDAKRDIVKLLSQPKQLRPHALCCLSDEYALLAANIATALSLRIPEDIAIFGFGNTILTQLGLVGISSAEQHLNEVGRKAFEVVCSESSKFHKQYILLPVELIERESTRGTK